MAIEAYLPLYRKYRPQSFADLVGQEAIAQTLGNAIALNKVAHAYLFCGPRGTGKTSSARILAKSLNCEQGASITPCQTCDSCVGITAGSDLDVIEFDAASNNKVDDARELIESCQFAPMKGRYKIYIIDEVHMLTPSAFNALLKTLEEPPENVIFIFATTEVHKVLPTIISRCQRFDFQRIRTSQIAERLGHIAEQEEISIEADALTLIARHSKGGMRDALGLLDQVGILAKMESGKTITVEDVQRFTGTLAEETLLALSKAIAQQQSDTLLNALNELSERGVEPQRILKDLTHHLRNLLLVKACRGSATPDTLDLSADYLASLEEQVALFEPEELPQIVTQLGRIENDLRRGSDPLMWLEVGLIGLAFRHSISQVQQLEERLSKLEAQLSGSGPVLIPPTASPTAVQAPAPMLPPSPSTAPSMPPAAMPATVPAPSFPPSVSVPQPMAESGATTVPSTAPAAPAMAATGSASGAMMKALQPGFFDALCKQIASPPVRAIVQQHAHIHSVDGGVITFGCSNAKMLEMIQDPKRKLHIQKALNSLLGTEAQLAFSTEKKSKLPLASGPAPFTPPLSTAVSPVSPAKTQTETATDTSPQLPQSVEIPASMPGPVGPPPLPEPVRMTEETSPTKPVQSTLSQLGSTPFESEPATSDPRFLAHQHEATEQPKDLVSQPVESAPIASFIDAEEQAAWDEAKQNAMQILGAQVL